MLRPLALCFLAAALHAQIWQDPQNLISYHTRDIESAREQVRFERGPVKTKLLPPPALEGQKIQSWDHLDGCTYILGLPRHPAYGSAALSPFRSKSPFQFDHLMPLELYRSRDFRTWEKVGRYQRDTHGRPQALHPLRDGSFLAIGNLFWDGDAISPFARYQLDAQGLLRFERLVDPGFGEPLFRPFTFNPNSEEGKKWVRGAGVSKRYSEVARGSWQGFRLPSVLVLVDKQSGWTLILDPNDGRVLARLHPYPGMDLSRQNVAWQTFHLGAHAASDGTLLLAFRQPEILRSFGGDYSEFFLHWDRLTTASSRQAYQLLKQRETRQRFTTGREVVPLLSEIRWFRLNPGQRTLIAIPAPPGAPTRMATVWESFRLRFEVKPDGSVARIDPPKSRLGIAEMLRPFFW